MLTRDDFRGAGMALLPPGELLDFQHGGNAWQLLDAEAEMDLAIYDDASALLREMVPSTCYQLLPEWERDLGLPDPDGPQNLSIADRIAAVVARWTAEGKLTPQYLINQAAAMGYPGATITEFDVTSCESSCEEYLYGVDWAFTFLMTLPTTPEGLGASCDGGCEDYLGIPFNSHIENYIRRLKPARTFALFAYV